MYYKNYWINYVSFGDVFACAICNKDMTNFVNTEFDEDYMHIIKTFSINRYKWEHAENYLDEDGLFMGIFPLDIIKQSIDEWNNKQLKASEEFDEKIKYKYKEPLKEDFFKELKELGLSLLEIIKFINSNNNKSKKYWNIEFSIENYYKDILIKYWGDYKV